MSAANIRACSFLPAATNIISALGLGDRLCGVTFECESEMPKVVRSALEGRSLTAGKIDQIVSRHAASGEPLYRVDEPLLQSLAPDVIFTQDVCAVCQIDAGTVSRAAAKLKSAPQIVPLLPHRLADIFTDIQTIADALGEPERGRTLVAALTGRVQDVKDRIRDSNAATRETVVIEWIDPVYSSGHWIPDQVECAGGIDRLGAPGGRSAAVSWDAVREYDPEVLIVTACGFDLGRLQSEARCLLRLPGWEELQAVQGEKVFLVSAKYLTEPGPMVVDGVELLAELIHPELFPKSDRSASFSHFAEATKDKQLAPLK